MQAVAFCAGALGCPILVGGAIAESGALDPAFAAALRPACSPSRRSTSASTSRSPPWPRRRAGTASAKEEHHEDCRDARVALAARRLRLAAGRRAAGLCRGRVRARGRAVRRHAGAARRAARRPGGGRRAALRARGRERVRRAPRGRGPRWRTPRRSWRTCARGGGRRKSRRCARSSPRRRRPLRFSAAELQAPGGPRREGLREPAAARRGAHGHRPATGRGSTSCRRRSRRRSWRRAPTRSAPPRRRPRPRRPRSSRPTGA